jgi:hypothetical protein
MELYLLSIQEFRDERDETLVDRSSEYQFTCNGPHG